MDHVKRISWKTILAAVFCALCLLTVADLFWIRHQVNQDITRLQAIVASLARSDLGYADLKVIRSTESRAFIFGTLDSRERVETLRIKVAEQFGAEKARHIVSLIHLASATTRPD